MKTLDKKHKREDRIQLTINQEGTVRGSGFTYTEKRERTDKSVPKNEVKEEEVIPLPDLGRKNRP